MASIVGKRVNGGTYYYLVESARVDGRPRIVAQRYLGSAADIAAALDGGGLGVPARTEHHAFGAVAAVWATLTRLGLPDLVDEVTATRRAPTGLGLRLALAVLHPVVAPTAEFGLGDWWQRSAAPRFVRPRPDPDALQPRAFWAAMNRLTEPRLAELTARLADRLTTTFDLGADALAVDLPGFETLTAADEDPDPARLTRPPAPILLGLNLVVSRDGMVPLAARAYRRAEPGQPGTAVLPGDPGGHPRGADELTVVLEPGRPERIDELIADGRHVVTALPVTDADPGIPDLPAHPAYRALDEERFPGVRVWDTRAVVSTARRRVIAVRSATLHTTQSRAFADALATAIRRLAELDAALAAGTIRRTRDRLLTEVARITRPRRVDRVLTVSMPEPGPVRLRWQVDEAAWQRLHRDVFGHQLLVTDRDDWPVEQVLTAYRARYYLDATFGQFGGPIRPAPWPGFGWTARRIAVHTLIGTLAATVTHLLRLQAHRIGIDLSVRELLDCLDGMQETVLRYPSTGGRPRTVRRLTERTPTQQLLFDAYGLRRYAPRD